MRILGAVFLAIALAGTAGCAPPPPPVLAHAESTAGLRVRITDTVDYLGNGEDEEKDEERRKAGAAAQHALVTRLADAGYVVVDKGPYDVSAATWFATKRPPHEDMLYARARLRLKDRKGQVVDEITLEYKRNAAPVSEPDRVAISLINEMNKSPKLASLAQRRAKSEPAPTTAPAAPAPPTTAPAPATDTPATPPTTKL